MRTRNSVRNVTVAMLMSVAAIVVGLIAQRVFINTLGTEYLGINGLFTSVVSMLALVELGLGSAIYYHLYRPVANADIARIKSLVSFYKKGYRVIAVAVFLLGVLFVPFLRTLVGDVNIAENIYLIYLLFLVDIVFSYLLTYKRAVLYVDQNSHIISVIHLLYLVALNVLQVAVLLVTGNFYLYLVVKIVMRLAENILLTLITNRKYAYLKDTSVEALDNITKSEIYKKIRGLAYHKVATYVVLGTDSIIISIFFGITTVGLYGNYYLVIAAVGMIMGQVFTALTSSVGNLLVKAKSKQSFIVYSNIRFGNLWLSCFAATSFFVVMDSFVALWVGVQYTLPFAVLLALSVNLYIALVRAPMSSFKEAAGIFHRDRFVPVIESIANIVFSLTLLHYLGLAGVFLGTACSTLIVHLFSYPKYVYKPLFKQGYAQYYRDFIKSLLIAFFIGAVTFAVSRSITVEGSLATFIVNILLCLLIPNVILFIIFRNSSELKFYKQIVKKAIQSATKRLR